MSLQGIDVGDVGGRAPDFNEWTLYGSMASYRIQDWNKLMVGDDGGWRDLQPTSPPARGLAEQLDAVARDDEGEELEGRIKKRIAFHCAVVVPLWLFCLRGWGRA